MKNSKDSKLLDGVKAKKNSILLENSMTEFEMNSVFDQLLNVVDNYIENIGNNDFSEIMNIRRKSSEEIFFKSFKHE
jgi:hypothetical protein